MFLKGMVLQQGRNYLQNTRQDLSSTSGQNSLGVWEKNAGNSWDNFSAEMILERELGPGTGFLQSISKTWKKKPFWCIADTEAKWRQCSVCLRNSFWLTEQGKRTGPGQRPLFLEEESRHTYNLFYLLSVYTEKLFLWSYEIECWRKLNISSIYEIKLYYFCLLNNRFYLV